jgi:hypothetical protein
MWLLHAATRWSIWILQPTTARRGPICLRLRLGEDCCAVKRVRKRLTLSGSGLIRWVNAGVKYCGDMLVLLWVSEL